MYSTEDDEFWLGYEPPENPFGVYLETHGQIADILQVDIRFEDPQLLWRMAFTQLVAAAEAYLADTLIREVLNNRDRAVQLATQDKYLNQEKFTLGDLARNQELLTDKIRSYLRSVLYHNLDRVRALYRMALEIEIKVNDDEWTFLGKAMEYRHDCVHRNGYDQDGNRLTLFSRDYVRRSSEILTRMVRKVEKEVSS